MIVVADSGPLIQLASVNQFSLLKRFFHTIPQIYEEVVAQGQGRAGDFEMRQALQDRWVLINAVADSALIQRFIAASVSATDAAILACAVTCKATLLLADDRVVREMAKRERLAVMGTVGILVEGLVDRLQPLLDRLIVAGFYLEPAGRVYQDALKRVGEL